MLEISRNKSVTPVKVSILNFKSKKSEITINKVNTVVKEKDFQNVNKKKIQLSLGGKHSRIKEF